MKAYLVDAMAREIRPIDYEYTTILSYLPGGITIAAVFASGDVLYVDDEGLLRPATVAFRVLGRDDAQPMMSNAILTGPDDAEGTSSPRMTVEDLAREIEWLDVETALDWFRAKANDAAVISHGPDGTHVLATWEELLRNLTGESGGYRP
jgi:hypothetical protein